MDVDQQRPTATVVIPVWNRFDQTERCLRSLRPTLGPGDRVVVVDNGSTDGTAAGLIAFPWVTVLTNATNRGFAAASNQGAEWALGQPEAPDVVVYLNNDTVPVGDWLDRLLAVFVEAPDIGGAGPRSNFVSGPQMVQDVPYRDAGSSPHEAFVRAWAWRHAGARSRTGRLVGFALAVRAAALREVGGFDPNFGIGGCEDDDLCRRLADAGWGLVICHDAFVHHEGHATFDGNGVDWLAVQTANVERLRAAAVATPLLSACMIVRDEQQALPGCLAALDGVVDEVVVYDTGSTDATPELARRAGAVVVDGYWDDDFGRARNSALSHCRGTWILHVDADEVLACDPPRLRALLTSAVDVDAFSVRIDNLVGHAATADVTHRALRLFRRRRGRWSGRLHEQVVPSSDGRPLRVVVLGDDCTITHTGYLPAEMAAKNKRARNLAIAEAAFARSGDSVDRLHLARSLTAVGRRVDAIAHYEAALAALSAGTDRRMTLVFGIEALLSEGRFADAARWAEDLAASCTDPSLGRYYEAVARRRMGDYVGAATLLEGLSGRLGTEDGYVQPDGDVEIEQARVFVELGRSDEAAAAMRALVARTSEAHAVSAAFACYEQSGRQLDELVADVPGDRLLVTAAAVSLLPSALADRVAELLVGRFGLHPAVVAASARFAPGLGIDRALEWSARLRAVGLTDHCPLVARAASPGVAPDDRAVAAAVALRAFADPRAAALVQSAVGELTHDQHRTVMPQLLVLVPQLFGVDPETAEAAAGPQVD